MKTRRKIIPQFEFAWGSEAFALVPEVGIDHAERARAAAQASADRAACDARQIIIGTPVTVITAKDATDSEKRIRATAKTGRAKA